MMRYIRNCGGIVCICLASLAFSESAEYFISGGEEEWAGVEFGWQARKGNERLAAIPSKMNEFLAGLDSDTKRLTKDVITLSDVTLEVLNNYVDIRDKWIESQEIDKVFMALAITQAVDEVLAISTVQAESRGEGVASQLYELSGRNILSMSSVFAELDRYLKEVAPDSRSLSSFCGEVDYYGRTECWKQYIGQFSLSYTEEMVGGEVTFTFIDMKLKSELDSLSRFSKLQSILTNVESVMILDNPSCYVYFVASVLDRRAMTAALMDWYKVPSKQRIAGAANGTLERVLSKLGVPGSRWLVVSVITGDEFSDGLAAIVPKTHPDGLSMEMRQWMLDRETGMATKSADVLSKLIP